MKIPILLFCMISCPIFSVIAGNSEFVWLYPNEKGFEQVLGPNHSPLLAKSLDQLSFNLENIKKNKIRLDIAGAEGDAYNFQTLSNDQGLTPSQKKATIRLDLIAKWDIDSLRQVDKTIVQENNFDRVLSELTHSRLQGHKETADRYGDYNGLRSFTYEKSPCLLLWDNVDQRSVTLEKVSGSNYESTRNVYSFDYSLRKAKQVALCRYAENCYVLLLLTNPIQDMPL